MTIIQLEINHGKLDSVPRRFCEAIFACGGPGVRRLYSADIACAAASHLPFAKWAAAVVPVYGWTAR